MKYWEKYVVKTKCQKCGKLFEAYLYNIKRGWGKFCSTRCSKKDNKNRLGKYFTLESRKKIAETLRRKMLSGEIKSPLMNGIGKTKDWEKCSELAKWKDKNW